MKPLTVGLLCALALVAACSDRKMADTPESEASADDAIAAAVMKLVGTQAGAHATSVGPDNELAIGALVDCDHHAALEHIQKATQSDDDGDRLAAAWLQAVVESELGSDMEPYWIRVMEADRDVSTEDAVKKGIKSVQHEVESRRARLGRSKKCP